jgi:capsular exopolysaccharide synthesis family protein
MGRMLAFSFVLGLAFGVFLAMVLEALDDTFHAPDDITAYTDVSFLGIVPLLEESGQGLITVTSPKSPPAEAYRTLRSNIHFAQLDSPARTFMVTSAGAGEGKTLTTANLACVFAQSGQEVLLVDADLRRPSLHRLFGLPSDQGLTNVLVGEAALSDVAQQTAIPGLRVVTTGPLPPNPAELIESQQMTAMIERSREIADIVLFDSPPAIILTDAVILSSKVERTILVAEAGQVSRDAFNEMCRIIRNARGQILGVVLNKLRLGASDYYYYYYYYDYSHYAPRGSATEQKSTPETGQGQIRPETPTVLDTLFGEDGPPTGDGASAPDSPARSADAGATAPSAPPTSAAPPPTPGPAASDALEQPSSKRWRFNGRGFRADLPTSPQPAQTEDPNGKEQPTGNGTQDAPVSPPQNGNPSREPSILDELFGEDEEDQR